MASQRESGMDKRVAEPFYMKDWLSDLELQSADLATRGAWIQTLCAMWLDKTDRVTKTADQLARFWGCERAEVERILGVLASQKICTVTVRHDNITLVSRRLSRRTKARNSAAKRQKEARARKASQARHGGVTAEKGPSSFSSSFSSSEERELKDVRDVAEGTHVKAVSLSPTAELLRHKIGWGDANLQAVASAVSALSKFRDAVIREGIEAVGVDGMKAWEFPAAFRKWFFERQRALMAKAERAAREAGVLMAKNSPEWAEIKRKAGVL